MRHVLVIGQIAFHTDVTFTDDCTLRLQQLSLVLGRFRRYSEMENGKILVSHQGNEDELNDRLEDTPNTGAHVRVCVCVCSVCVRVRMC